MPAAAMPVNVHGARIAAGPYDRNDGFSPGSAIVLHVPGLDSPAALNRTGAVPWATSRPRLRAPPADPPARRGDRPPSADLGRARRQRAERRNARPADPSGAQSDRGAYLRRRRCAACAPPHGARDRRAGLVSPAARRGPLPAAERAQRARYARIFATLHHAHVACAASMRPGTSPSARRRASPVACWPSATPPSPSSATATSLICKVAGHAPAFTVSGQSALSPVNGVGVTSVTGTVTVPCYLTVCGDSAAPGFHYSARRRRCGPDPDPRQSVATASFECIVPATATPADPARISLYGHGLLGGHGEVEAGNVQGDGHRAQHRLLRHRLVGPGQRPTRSTTPRRWPTSTCSPPVIDRLQQGVLNTLFLGRLMLHPQGLAAAPAFRVRRGAGDRHLAPLLRRQQPGRDRGRHDDRGRAGLHPRRARRDRRGLRQPARAAQRRLRALRLVCCTRPIPTRPCTRGCSI